jgi:mercuric ion transport protein
MRVLPRLPALRQLAAAEDRRLLRVLLVGVGALSARAGIWQTLLLNPPPLPSPPQASATMTAATPGAAERAADTSGVLAACFAALCCAGNPVILSVLAALGLGFLRRDAILWPLMLLSLAVALWGLWRGTAYHRRQPPLWLGVMGGAALVAGVIFFHGFASRVLMWSGVALLLGATLANLWSRRSCRVAGLAA